MFLRILVPLDGSQLAESVLPVARFLALSMGARVVLVHVIEQNAPQVVHGERHLTQAEEAKHYLEHIAREVFGPDVPVEWHVHYEEIRNVARSIVDHVSELETDLIVMCSHGRGGMRDWVIGSIAMQVIAMGKTPVLLMHPVAGGSLPASAVRFQKALVALDGQPAHEASLEVVVPWTRLLKMSLHLVNVVETWETLKGQRAVTGRLLPATAAAMLEMSEEEAGHYLESKAVFLRSSGLIVTTEVRRGDPAREILRAAQEAGCDLIVLGTHGKAGMEAIWAGSVTPRVAAASHLPLLLVPVGYAST